MRKVIYIINIVFSVVFFSCDKRTSEEIIEEIELDDEQEIDQGESQNYSASYKILSLGDSYTIGESVCDECKFPEQLKNKVVKHFTDTVEVSVKVLARTGWTTSDLLNSLSSQEIENNYDFVTLLIGVNNQFQGVPFEVYKNEFPELVNSAINYVNGNKQSVVVLSIPDYAFTPFGQGNLNISSDLLVYNNFAAAYCSEQNITYLNITDITQQGLESNTLVAEDGLHPSSLAYKKFVDRLFPLFLEKVNY